jgi:PHD/YefM family antitoxin component YafN of YafNO toxin-antitoxin module
MKTIAINDVRENIYDIADETITNSIPVAVSTKKGNMVIISEDDYNAIMETLYLKSIKGFKESLDEADREPWVSENEVCW